jgi:hypothetical protein
MRARLCSGRLLRRALLAVALLTAVAGAQTAPKSGAKKASAHRANELTLAGLQPGRDALHRAVKLLGGYVQIDPSDAKGTTDKAQAVWMDNCRGLLLSVDLDTGKDIQVVRLSTANWLRADCEPIKALSRWKTGHGLRVGDDATKMGELYGEPDSRSPSTKEGQPLELWYYAFDWAGADVPQVMEVLCTREADGKPGRVVEITLAGPSL